MKLTPSYYARSCYNVTYDGYCNNQIVKENEHRYLMLFFIIDFQYIIYERTVSNLAWIIIYTTMIGIKSFTHFKFSITPTLNKGTCLECLFLEFNSITSCWHFTYYLTFSIAYLTIRLWFDKQIVICSGDLRA